MNGQEQARTPESGSGARKIYLRWPANHSLPTIREERAAFGIR